MREIPQDLRARLDGGATTLARCWRIDRRDGVSLGFTDHDGDLVFDGVTFLAASGLEASQVEASTGLSVDSQSITGALRSAAITEEDLRRGRYAGATVTQWLVDWTDVALRVVIFHGSIGEISHSEHAFEAEVVGLLDRLDAPTGRAYLRSCDAALGDTRCGVDLTDPAFSASATVLETGSATRMLLSGLGGFSDGWFDHGTLTWTSGGNDGEDAQVQTGRQVVGGYELDLWLEPGGPIAVGDTLTVRAGCDKRSPTCRAKFSNIMNFRGFPHLPGEDWIVSHPEEGGIHDGGSLFRS